MKNAFVHPKWKFYAFQLSAQQIAHFSSLRKFEDNANLSDAESLLPFTREPDAHSERTWTRRGDPPLRIYKNNYDRVPPETRFRCVARRL